MKRGIFFFCLCCVCLIYSNKVLKSKLEQNKINEVIEFIGYSSHTVLTVEIDQKLPETWNIYKFETIDRVTSGIDRIKYIPWDYMIVSDLHKNYGDERKIRWNKSLLEHSDYMPIFSVNRNKKWFTDAIEYTVFKRKKEAIPIDLKGKAVIGSKSTYSESGQWTLDQLAEQLNKWGVKTWMPTDTLISQFEYKVHTISQKSVISEGLDNYINDLERLQKKYPKMQIIPAVEVMDGYKWEGSLLTMNLTLVAGKKHYAKITKDRKIHFISEVTGGDIHKIKHQFAYYQPSSNCYEYGKKGWTCKLEEMPYR